MSPDWWENGVTWSHAGSIWRMPDPNILEVKPNTIPQTVCVTSTPATCLWVGVADCVGVGPVSRPGTLAVGGRRTRRGADRSWSAAGTRPMLWGVRQGGFHAARSFITVTVVIRYKCCGVNVDTNMRGCTNIYQCCNQEQGSEGCTTVCRRCGAPWGSVSNNCYKKEHNIVNKSWRNKDIFKYVFIIVLKCVLNHFKHF